MDKHNSKKGPAPADSNVPKSAADLEEVVVESRQAKPESPGWDDRTRVKEPGRQKSISFAREDKVKPDPDDAQNSVRKADAQTRIPEPSSESLALANVSSTGVAGAGNESAPGTQSHVRTPSVVGNLARARRRSIVGKQSSARRKSVAGTKKGMLAWDDSTVIQPPRRPRYIPYQSPGKDKTGSADDHNKGRKSVDGTHFPSQTSQALALANVSSTGVGETAAEAENIGTESGPGTQSRARVQSVVGTQPGKLEWDSSTVIQPPSMPRYITNDPAVDNTQRNRLNSLRLASSQGGLREALRRASEQNQKDNRFNRFRKGITRQKVPLESSGSANGVGSVNVVDTEHQPQHNHIVAHVLGRTRFRGDFLGHGSNMPQIKRFLVSAKEESSTPISSDTLSSSSGKGSQRRRKSSQRRKSSSKRLRQSFMDHEHSPDYAELMWLKGDFPYERSSESEDEAESKKRFNAYDPSKVMNSVFLFWLYALLLGRMPFTFVLDRKRNSYVCIVDRTRTCYWWFIITSILLLGIAGLCLYSTAEIIMIELETNSTGPTSQNGTDTQDFHLLLAKLLMDKHWLYLIFFMCSVFAALFVSLDVILNGNRIAGCITEILVTMQSLNYDASLGIRRDVIVFLIMANLRNVLSLYAFTMGPISASVFKTYPEAMHLLTICLFRPFSHDIRSFEPYFSTILTTTSFVLFLYATLCARTMIIVGMMMAKGIENIANEWSFRLGLKLGLVTMTSHETGLVPISSLRYRKLLDQHNRIAELIKSISSAFGHTIIGFYLIQMLIIIGELFYVSIVFVRDNYKFETANLKPVTISGHLYEYLDSSIISIIPGLFYVVLGFASFWHTSTYFCEAGDAVSLTRVNCAPNCPIPIPSCNSAIFWKVLNGFYYIRRHSLVMCQTGREMQFMLSLMMKFSDRCKYYINPHGFFAMNREFVFYFLLTAITLFSVMIQCKIRPLVTVPIVVPCVRGQLCADGSECSSAGLCKGATSFPAGPDAPTIPKEIIAVSSTSPSPPTSAATNTTASTSTTTPTTTTTTATTTTRIPPPPKLIPECNSGFQSGPLYKCPGTNLLRPIVFNQHNVRIGPSMKTIPCIYDPYGPLGGIKPGLTESRKSQFKDCFGDPIERLDYLGIPIIDKISYKLLRLDQVYDGEYSELVWAGKLSSTSYLDHCVNYNARADYSFEFCGLLYTTLEHVLTWRLNPARPPITEAQFKENNVGLPLLIPGVAYVHATPPKRSCDNLDQLEAERLAGTDSEFWTKAPLTRSSEPHAMYRNPYLNRYIWKSYLIGFYNRLIEVTVVKLSALVGFSLNDNLQPYDFINTNLFPLRSDGYWSTFLVDCDGSQLIMDDCGGLNFRKWDNVTKMYNYDGVSRVTVPASGLLSVSRACFDWTIPTETCGVPKDKTNQKCAMRKAFLEQPENGLVI